MGTVFVRGHELPVYQQYVSAGRQRIQTERCRLLDAVYATVYTRN